MPKSAILDNGPELPSKAIFFWLQKTDIRLNFIQPGNGLERESSHSRQKKTPDLKEIGGFGIGAWQCPTLTQGIHATHPHFVRAAALRSRPKSAILPICHMGRPHTTIGAEHFHFRVRNGIGWFLLAMAARRNWLFGV